MKLCIVQARMSSTRFPGKVLKEINHKTMLELLLFRISGSVMIDELIVVISKNKSDDVLAEYLSKKKVKYFRGSEEDVLDRFYQAVRYFEMTPDCIIRLTADCPLHHAEVVDFAVSEFYKSNLDYFSNSNQPPVLEDGCDTEVFTWVALQDSWKNSTKKSEREHVTPYIKNSGNNRCAYKKYSADYNFKLSVDNENDFKTVSGIFNSFYPDELFSVSEMIIMLNKHPELLNPNSSSIINEGYRKSLESEE